MEYIAEEVKRLADGTDQAGRRKMALALRDLSYSLEAPKDTISRIVSSVLSGRYLRYFASFGMVTETAKDIFAANNITKALADPGKEAEVKFHFDTIGPVYQATPAFLRSHNFTNPESAVDCPFQLAYNTTKSNFDFFPELPAESLETFDKYMSTRTAETASWLSVYPLIEEVSNCGMEEVVFVDVGGGIGHQCVALRDKYPDLKGRVIVQDLDHPIAGRIPHPSVKGMVHDFFNEQPVKGARFYYLRAVLHDRPDEPCRIILARLREALTEKSRILIEEMVLPNAGVDWAAAHTDLNMMSCSAVQERTQDQWESLLDGIGLRIVEQRSYHGGWSGYDSVITVAKK
ncbi:Demethylsterigmatocystin 6-O-methyltransferase [Lachnellula suecica]|uniref:Demethylsterigmatocystin 6-O-methyltransferase n=1 Tax=Lachnellula suecica TaxID=602035 RepID=A0A8T9C7I4_9HELO|nr:Demethylsterigmatocystin 6-O-methyltransferase [Lachnellula suecica]